MKRRNQQQQQSDPLKCPRCDSMKTKFCYYNNYNKSQPRHFCKDCKRHWTNGGTLRDVPIGGGGSKKNYKRRRLKTSDTAAVANDSAGNFSSSFNGVNLNGSDQSGISISTGSASSLLQNHPDNYLALTYFDTIFMSSSSSSLSDQLWPPMLPSLTTTVMDMPQPGNWDWEEIDKFRPTDLNIPWDDIELQLQLHGRY
ncbi:hypothetical protein Dimus_035198 [Dionaea muscipula]